MPSNTGATPTQTGPNPTAIPVQPLSGEQQTAADAHDQTVAKDRLTFALADTLLPVLNQNVTIGALRYFVGLAIDQVLVSDDGRALRRPRS